MDIYEGTSNLLMEILPHENVTIDRLIPQNLIKMAAAQRFTILLGKFCYRLSLSYTNEIFSNRIKY